jgi:List-Bact-rpt repeat protein
MIRKWFVATALVIAACSLFSLSSCAHNQHLVGITIQPGNGTFGAVDPSAFFLYKAYGTYIHPPKTVDITSQVTWQTDNPQVAQFTSPGTVSPNTSCGVAQIFASMHDSPNDIVSNLVSITVDGPASLGCPQGTATNILTLNLISGASDGSITSSPAGINCGASGTICAVAFQSGSTVSLTASPDAGHTFLGFTTGCTSGAGNTCNVIMNGDVTVTASFD